MTFASNTKHTFITSSKLELRLIALALGFGCLGALSLVVQRHEVFPFIALIALSACSLASHAWLNRVAPTREITILPVVTMLLSFGLIMIGRVAPNFLSRQLGALLVATCVMCIIASGRDELRWLRRFKYTWLITALVLLAATLVFGVNPTGFGARLWLTLGGAFFQPSEILRLLMIAFLAAYFAERLETSNWSLHGCSPPISRLQTLIPTVVMWLIAVALLITQQDFGAATLLLLTFGLMLYLATGDARLPLSLLAALLVAGAAGYFLSARVAQRLTIWWNPWADPQGSSFQVVQSLIAVASGGVFGQGVNQGRPDYVPAVHTDFPFVMIAEEMGLIGALGLIACYATLCLQAWHIALRAKSTYRMLLAGGIAAAFAIQVFIIIGGNLSLVPLTGVTLPFVSVGGTSLVTSFIAVGLLIRVSADDASSRATSRATAFRHKQSSITSAGMRAIKLTVGMFAALALTAGMWGIVRAGLLTKRDDNPRRVDTELAIQRGALFDHTGRVIADSIPLSSTNDARTFRRQYLVPQASSAVGYYSQRYGVGGIEAFADRQLRGKRTVLDELLHRPQVGKPITLTLDAQLQVAVQDALQSAMPNTVTRGAAIVLDASTGQVLALASAPSFDPNVLDKRWEQLAQDPFAPLVNRATQGLYQPGRLLMWMVYRWVGTRQLTNEDASSFISHLSSFALDKPVPFELQNQAVPYSTTATISDTLGQGTLRLTPLRVAAVAAQLATGAPVTPTLLLANPRPRKVVQPVQEIITFARISEDRVVGWLVRMIDTRVIVVAIEMPEPSETALEHVARATISEGRRT